MLVGRPAKKRHTENVHEPAEGSKEAYEDNWYRVLAGKAASGGQEADSSDEVEPTSSEPAPPQPEQPPPAQPAVSPAEDQVVVELVPTPVSQSRAAPPTQEVSPQPQLASVPASVRIGVRRLEDPEGTYLHYLTRSRHADFFRSDLWPTTRELTPVHLWRANHIGAKWDLESVVGFMQGPARRLEQLVASAPSSSSPGSADRRTWIKRLFHSEWVEEFGLGRITKTIHPLLPNLVPDIDPEMMSWARAEWLGVRGEPDDVDACVEVWEVLEDVLVVRADALDQIVRSVRGKAQRRAPTGRLGLVLAAFWESYWREVESGPELQPVEPPKPAKPAVAKPRACKRATTKAKASKAAAADEAPRPRRSRSTGPTSAD
jgi:hypothetical protein